MISRAFLIASLGLACSRSAAPPSEPTAAPTVAPTPPGAQHVIRLRGSNTVGVALAPALVQAFLQKKGATSIQTHHDPKFKEELWVSADLGGPLWIEIATAGTKYGFQSLAAGSCDIVLASRPVSDEEAKQLASSGDLTAPASENVIAMDGIAVIVHPNLAVDELSVDQLARVFSGEITNWTELGGPAQPIHVFARDSLSGTRDAFASLVMHDKAIKAERTFDDSQELAKTVHETAGAIGFVGLPYVRQTKALAIRDGAGQALFPTPFTVATEDYPLARRLFFYVPEHPADPLVRELVEFALSDDGQTLADKAGFVPLALRTDASHLPSKAPSAYAKLATGATRLSVDFRFKRGSSDVDNKAVHDLDRLTRYLASPMNRGRHLALAGFADAQGPEPTNQTLSRQRAEVIATMLKQRGVDVTEVASFGSALPIAPNDSAAGRARNRRVEVWLR
jgi:phosphate transport system substrate-binding protein